MEIFFIFKSSKLNHLSATPNEKEINKSVSDVTLWLRFGYMFKHNLVRFGEILCFGLK